MPAFSGMKRIPAGVYAEHSRSTGIKLKYEKQNSSRTRIS
jgi:hypothetical protein